MSSIFLRLASLALCLSCGLLSMPAYAQSDSQVTRRFALIVGANNGGRERTVLRYAQRDARTVAAVLEQLGGVDRSDRLLLLEPTPAQVSGALQQLQVRAKAARDQGQRTELLFYYSGHSDERGLLLAEERVPYREVRDGLVSVGAAVHVGMLDSCSSGALTRVKGGMRRAPFLLDNSNAVQGHAFLTSSSADEGAQESDRVGASFFTHYLVSGLRGAADFSGDGRVTLNEAYRFAFDETLARTEDTSAGPQHAAYDIQLVGTGDLVMTDLRETGAALHIPKGISGRMYLRDAQGNLVVELNKPAGRMIELALDAQTYQVLLDQDGKLSRATITLKAGTTVELKAESFVVVQGERNRLRGDEPTVAAEYRTVPFAFGIVPPYSNNERFGGAGRNAPIRVKNYASLNFGYGRGHVLEGVGIAMGVQQVHERTVGLQIGLGANLTDQLQGGQIALGLNMTKDMTGAQIASGLNITRHHFQGMQVGLTNFARTGEGLQLSLGNLIKDMTGAQIGLGNAASSIKGMQLGLGNGAAEFDGLQLGLANFSLAVEATGAQIGLFNLNTGRLRGLQLGLFNYADKASAQIGLLSITREGGVHPLLFISDVISMQVGLRFDAEYTYSVLLAGLEPESGSNTYSFGLGFGGKIPVTPKVWIEPELSQQTLALDGKLGEGNPSSLSRFALNARYQLHSHVSFFGGPTYSVIMHNERNNHDRRPGWLDNAKELSNGKSRLQVLGMLGFVAGASF